MNVLISGASIAGPALAYWLKRNGITPTLVERAPASADAVENHLPTSIEDRLLDSSSVGLPLVGLQERDHREKRGRLRRIAARHVRVHHGELGLERLVEEFVPVIAEEGEQSTRTSQPLANHRLDAGEFDREFPAGRARHPRQRSSRRLRVDPFAQAIETAVVLGQRGRRTPATLPVT